MTVSYDQMLAVHDGKTYVFVPYAPRARYDCNGGACVFFRNATECFLYYGRHCLERDRKDGRAGYWKLADTPT